VILYVKNIGERFIHMFKNIQYFKLAFYGINKLNKFIKVFFLKDPLPIYSRLNVVYRIDCAECDVLYVGQTWRLLIKKINEHRSYIRRNKQASIITDHWLYCSHDFDWNNIQFLDEEVHISRRLISETIYIKKQKMGLNVQSDTELLDPIYDDLIR